MRFGSGSLTYEVVEGWGNLPAGIAMGEVPAVAVDSKDRVYAFNRGPHPMIVFDRDGNFLTTWGEGVFVRPHGIKIDADDFVYCVDDGDHTVRKCTTEGKVVLTLGVPGQVSDTGYVPGDFLSVKRGGPPFYRPTNIDLSPEGNIYVTDGYGNARVHCFTPDGRLLFSWGEPGSGPGQFRLVHGICIDPQGIVYVGDRMNSRVQVFSPKGEYITEWNDSYQPNDLFLDGTGHVFIPELGYNANLPMSGPVPAPGDGYPRVSIRDLTGKVLASITSPDACAPGGFRAPHGLRLDSQGSLYVGEVSATSAKRDNLDPSQFHVLQKFVRVQG